MLNDLSGWTRAVVAGQVAPLGLLLGLVLAPRVVGDAGLTASVVVLVLVVLGQTTWLVAVLVSLRRRDRAFRATLAARAADLARGSVRGVPAAGRVVRPDAGRRAGPPVALCTALAPEGPRRVAAPAPYGAPAADGPVALLLHPQEREVAVLVPGVGPADLAAIASDPRWSTARLPTSLSVVGGVTGLLVATATGLVLGAGVSLAVVALVH